MSESVKPLSEDSVARANEWMLENVGYDYAGFAQIGSDLISEDTSKAEAAVEQLATRDRSQLMFVEYNLRRYAFEDDAELSFFDPETTIEQRRGALYGLEFAARELSMSGDMVSDMPAEYDASKIANQATHHAHISVDLEPIRALLDEIDSMEASDQIDAATRLSEITEALKERYWGKMNGDAVYYLQLAHHAVRQVEGNKKFYEALETIPKVDQEEFDHRRLTYGAKAANLMLLQERIDAINALWPNNQVPLEVPPFITLSVDVCRAIEAGEADETQLLTHYQQIMEWVESVGWEGRYIVRSSAVHGEDGEHTGAGVYESVEGVDEDGFNGFMAAIHTVLDSVNSEKAVAYRQQHGIDEEAMALVIQPMYKARYGETLHVGTQLFWGSNYPGTLNTLMPGLPYMHNVSWDTHTVIDRRAVANTISSLYPTEAWTDEADHSIYPMTPDLKRVHTGYVQAVAAFGHVAEHLWDAPVQIEYANAPNGAPAIVQVRKLPASVLESEVPHIKFPDEDALYGAPAIGFIDKELEVLPNAENNLDKDGLVIIPDEDRATLDYSARNLPKVGAVAILQGGGHGSHMGTLALELGLPVMYYNPSSASEYMDGYQKLRELGQMGTGGEMFRVVMNGLEGRIYKPKAK